MDPNTIKIGQIVNTLGIKGELKVYLSTDFPEKRFVKGNTLYLGPADNLTRQEVMIQSSRPYKNMYIIKLQGFDNINDIEKYKNFYLSISKEQQGVLEEGEYYYHQIIGAKVVTIDGEDFGVVKEILSPGANDVWVVKLFHKNKDVLIPYIDSVVKQVNVKDRLITIEIMEGLLD